METRHFSRFSTVAGYCVSACAMCLAAMFLLDIAFVYAASTAYFFGLGLWYELGFAALAAVASVLGFSYFSRHR